MEHHLIQAAVLVAVYAIAIAATPLVQTVLGPAVDRGRDEVLDGMRGVAAVAVVGCHLNQYVLAFLGVEEPPLFGNHAGILGVQMFFALTAFLFTDRALRGKLSPDRFFLERVRRIVPLYLAVCVAALLIAVYYSQGLSVGARQMVLEALQVFSYGFWQTETLSFRDINMLSLVGIAWTLSYEWAFYLLLLPIMSLWNSGRAMRWLIACIVAMLLVRDFHVQSEQVIWPFFLPGVVAAFALHRVPAWAGTVLLFIATPAIAVIFLLPGFWTPMKLAAAFIVFFAVLFGRPRWLRFGAFQTLGAISYSVYLIQYLVLFPIVRTIFESPALASIESRIAMCALAAALTVLIAAFTYRYLELPWIAKPVHLRPAFAGAGIGGRNPADPAVVDPAAALPTAGLPTAALPTAGLPTAALPTSGLAPTLRGASSATLPGLR